MPRTIDGKEISADYATRLNVWTKETVPPYAAGKRTENAVRERRATISDAMAILFDGLNGPDHVTGQAVRESFAREHRTLQQMFIKRVVVPILAQLAEDGRKGYFDARNEQSVEFARRALKDFATSGEEYDLPYFPTI